MNRKLLIRKLKNIKEQLNILQESWFSSEPEKIEHPDFELLKGGSYHYKKQVNFNGFKIDLFLENLNDLEDKMKYVEDILKDSKRWSQKILLFIATQWHKVSIDDIDYMPIQLYIDKLDNKFSMAWNGSARKEEDHEYYDESDQVDKYEMDTAFADILLVYLENDRVVKVTHH